MAYGKPVWGVDVGQRALKALKVQWVDGAPRVLAVDIIEHPKILSQPDADEDQLIRDALETFVKRNDLAGQRVVISVPGQSAFARFIKLPPVEKKKIPEIVRYEARQQIPFAIEDVLWDYQPVGSKAGGLETEIGLFAIKKDLINDFISNFVMAKIDVDVVQIAPLALYNFLVADEQIGEGATVLLDMGAENTNLLISNGEVIWLRNIPLGGNNFTRALSKTRKLTFAAAETEKRNLRQSKEARQIFEAVQPVFAELLAEVQRSMGYFTSLHRDVRIERILGMGNAFKMPGLRRFLAQNLQYRVDQFQGFKRLGEADALQTAEAREHLMALPTAFGLALQGLEVAPLRTNLLPPEIARARIISRKKPLAAAAVGALAVAVGLSFLGAVLRQGRAVDVGAEQGAKRLISEIEADGRLYDQAWNIAQEQKKKTLPLQETVGNRGVWLVILTEFMKLLPKDGKEVVRLDTLEQVGVTVNPENEVESLVDPSIKGQYCWIMRFVGTTEVADATTFLRNNLFLHLQNSPIFSEVRPTSIERRRRTVSVPDPTDTGAGRLMPEERSEWVVEIRFFCLFDRAQRLARGEPPLEAGAETAATPPVPASGGRP